MRACGCACVRAGGCVCVRVHVCVELELELRASCTVANTLPMSYIFCHSHSIMLISLFLLNPTVPSCRWCLLQRNWLLNLGNGLSLVSKSSTCTRVSTLAVYLVNPRPEINHRNNLFPLLCFIIGI